MWVAESNENVANSAKFELGLRLSLAIVTLCVYMKQLPTDLSADRSTGPISLINYLISEVINFGRI